MAVCHTLFYFAVLLCGGCFGPVGLQPLLPQGAVLPLGQIDAAVGNDPTQCVGELFSAAVIEVQIIKKVGGVIDAAVGAVPAEASRPWPESRR